jgi:hypothetical protein
MIGVMFPGQAPTQLASGEGDHTNR